MHLLLHTFFNFLFSADKDDKVVISRIQDLYMNALQAYLEVHSPANPNKFGELILLIPQVQSAASLLLKNKMIWVPFLLNS